MRSVWLDIFDLVIWLVICIGGYFFFRLLDFMQARNAATLPTPAPVQPEPVNQVEPPPETYEDPFFQQDDSGI